MKFGMTQTLYFTGLQNFILLKLKEMDLQATPKAKPNKEVMKIQKTEIQKIQTKKN